MKRFFILFGLLCALFLFAQSVRAESCTNPGEWWGCGSCTECGRGGECVKHCKEDGSNTTECLWDPTKCGGGGGGGGGGTACTNQTFAQASVAPSTARPFDQVTVKCNYGKRLDCISITGAGLANCRYSRYEGTDNIFTCDAGQNAGFYDDAKCVLKSGTADNCCAANNKAGDMNIVGSEVHYDQDIVLPFASYTLKARVFSVISKGNGLKVSIICNSDTCVTGKGKNAEIASISFPESTDFVEKSAVVTLSGTGDDRHYLVRVSADKGSEGYFDLVSLKNASAREYVANGDFASTTTGSVTTSQPTAWGEGDNRIGYYYGSVADADLVQGSSPSIPGATQAPSGPTPTQGPATSVSLNLKIKLQGISKKPKTADSIKVLIKLAGSTGIQASGSATVTPFATVSQTVTFTVDDIGDWSGTANFANVPTGGGYKIYVKGPKHIQKKICDSAPTEVKPGTYHCGEGKIVLVAGANTFDFSNITLLAGDLPEAGGAQNGIVDAYDTTFIRTNLGSTDVTKLTTGDLNLDGIIDTQDYSMILQSLSIKFDEE